MAPVSPCIAEGSISATANERLTAATFAALALGVLIVGQAHPEPRVTFFEVPINTVLFVFAGIAFASGYVGTLIRRVVFIASLPVLLIVAASLWSPDIETGLIKSGNLYLSAILASGLLAASCAMTGVQKTLRVVLVLFALLLLFALIVKTGHGFFDRNVLFGLNGPIVFGRFMAAALVISVLVLKGALRAFAILLFLLAVAWTQSKGPMLSVLVVLSLISVFEGKGWRRLLGPALIVGSVTVLVGLAASLTDAPIIDRFVLAASYTDPDMSNVNYGSIGSRVESYTASLKLIEDEPLGVGSGGWATGTGLYYMEYPHNFILEMASELGLLLAPIAVLPFLAFLFSPVREFRYLALLLALAQQTSGDLLDSRMWLALSLASVAVRPIVPALLARHRYAA